MNDMVYLPRSCQAFFLFFNILKWFVENIVVITEDNYRSTREISLLCLCRITWLQVMLLCHSLLYITDEFAVVQNITEL